MTAPPAALILLAALTLDVALLALPSFGHAVGSSRRSVRRLWVELARRLDRSQRSMATLARRGVLIVIAAGAIAAAAGWALHRALARQDAGWIAELVVVALLLGQRDLFLGLRAVRRALVGGGLAAGRTALARQFGGGAQPADGYAVVRLACAASAESFVVAVVAPAFWYALTGLAGLFACAALLSLAAIVAGAPGRDAAFGRPAALMRALVLWLPARLGAMLLVAASLVAPGARPSGALKTLARDRGKRADAGGWPIAALAGGLGLSLGGPPQGAWIGDGRARAEPVDLKRTAYLLAVACLLDAGTVAAVAVGLAAVP